MNVQQSTFETPEDLYATLMALRAAGAQPPYIFVFPDFDQAKAFLDMCVEDDLERVTQDDIHLVIEQGGQFFRFTSFEDGKSVFEGAPYTLQ